MRHDGRGGKESAEVLTERGRRNHLACVGDEHREQEDHQQALAESAAGRRARHPCAWAA